MSELDKNIFAVGFVIVMAIVGFIIARFFVMGLRKIYAVPKKPDELEKLVELEASRKMKGYYSTCLVLVVILLNDRYGIEVLHVRTMALLLLVFGFCFERIILKKIADRFALPKA